MITNIETYLNSLSEDITILNISRNGLKYLPDLTRFKNLKKLNCPDNELTSLPNLPSTLEELNCSNNKLTFLSFLPQNLKALNCSINKLTSLILPENLLSLECSNNKLTSLQTLPQNLKALYCYNNKLTSLQTLPQNLNILYCSNNKLTSLILPENLEELYFHNNPIYEIVINNNLIKIKQNIQIFNNFRYLYYCLKFKNHFRKWLWEKVREPKIKKLYDPNYLVENLGDKDLEIVLYDWK